MKDDIIQYLRSSPNTREAKEHFLMNHNWEKRDNDWYSLNSASDMITEAHVCKMNLVELAIFLGY